jgi:bifunctional non-homologous end joining protein LigD
VGREFGSLLAGYYDGEGTLIFAGKIKTGYGSALSRSLISTLRQFEQPLPAFANPPSGHEYRNPHWLRPKLVAEVEFAEISGTGFLRNASFKGLREDKDAAEVTLEQAGPVHAAATAGNREEPVYPHERLTRSAVRSYYNLVSDRMLPHLIDRPLTLIVCRTNIYACKFTKHATNLPPPVRGVAVPGHAEKYIAIDSTEGLTALVDSGSVEFHGWQSRYAKLEFPDRMIFDLDPPEQGKLPWERLAEGALILRNLLLDHSLESFLQTTGGKGYYVVVPITPEREWLAVTRFAKSVAEEVEAAYPDRFTSNSSKTGRGERIYVDWMRNGRGANSAEAYSLRARPGAPVAAPITWEELVSGVKPDSFNAMNLGERLSKLEKDPWEGFFRTAQRIPGGAP